MKAWQEGLGGPPPMGRIYHPEAVEPVDLPFEAGQSQSANDNSHALSSPSPSSEASSIDDQDEDPEIQVAKREDFVPRRPGAIGDPEPDDSIWSSHLFWKGIVVGVVVVLVVKTAMAVHAPFGVDWYRF